MIAMQRHTVNRLRAIAGSAVAVIGIVPSVGVAQVLRSQLGSVAQTVDSTTIVVEYYRPQARGRELFGALVNWNDLWTPGANWATTLEVDRDVRIANAGLPRGKYSVWIRPQEKEPWEVILFRRARVFHLWPPPPEEEQLRFSVKPETVPHCEVLTWSFPAVMPDRAALELRWGTPALSFHILVEPSRPAR